MGLVPSGSPRLCYWRWGARTVRTHTEETGNGPSICTQDSDITRQRGACRGGQRKALQFS